MRIQLIWLAMLIASALLVTTGCRSSGTRDEDKPGLGAGLRTATSRQFADRRHPGTAGDQQRPLVRRGLREAAAQRTHHAYPLPGQGVGEQSGTPAVTLEENFDLAVSPAATEKLSDV